MSIVQGDQFPLKFTIKSQGAIISASDVDGVKIKIGDEIYEYPETISFDSSDNKWLVYIPQTATLKVNNGFLWCQVQVNYGGDPALIKTSTTSKLKVENGLIKQLWDDENGI